MDLGSSSYKWKNIYFQGNDITTTGTYFGYEINLTGNAMASTYHSNGIYGLFGRDSSNFMRVGSNNIYYRLGDAWSY